MTALHFVVHGDPAPQGSKRGFVIKGGARAGKVAMVESSAKVKPWRQDVVAAARAAMEANMPFGYFVDKSILDDSIKGPAPADAPLRIRLVFTVRKPASAPKRRTTHPMRKPDLDKLIRSTLDALGTAGVFTDDARVVTLIASKVYPGETLESLPRGQTGCKVWVEVIR